MGPERSWPWLHAALERVEIRRGDRVLQLTAHDTCAARAILELCGRDGTLVVLEPDLALAEQVAERAARDGLHVVAIEPDGSERFGRFDAVFGCPLWNPGWQLARWGTVVRHHLRPGGRFVVDLPAELACEPVDAAWQQAAAGDRRRARWHGPAEADAAAAFREAGLRRVEGLVGTHLVRFDSPRAVAELALAGVAPDPEVLDSLTVALASRLRTGAEVEVVFRRTRICGIR